MPMYCPSPPVVREMYDAGDMTQGVGDVVVRKAAELQRVDRVLHDLGVPLLFQGLPQALAQTADHHGFQLRHPAKLLLPVVAEAELAGRPRPPSRRPRSR